MSRVPDNSSLKRKRPDAPTKNLSDAERNIYEIIHKKTNMGIWTRDIRREITLPDTIFNKALKVLVTKNLIKEVVNIQNKTKKHYMAVEFEPSKELTGGTWYVDGKFDHEFIKVLKDLCKKIIQKEKLATIKSVSDAIKKSRLLTVECSMQQVADIMQSLIFDNEIMEIRQREREVGPLHLFRAVFVLELTSAHLTGLYRQLLVFITTNGWIFDSSVLWKVFILSQYCFLSHKSGLMIVSSGTFLCLS
ncbi:hypothetical protein ACHQM5_011296 [Ranunculus cassubicifolius]